MTTDARLLIVDDEISQVTAPHPLRIGAGNDEVEFRIGRLPDVTAIAHCSTGIRQPALADHHVRTREQAAHRRGHRAARGWALRVLRARRPAQVGYAKGRQALWHLSAAPGTERFEDTGVGLSIVQRAVERHVGRIVTEAQPGEGACFTFTLAQ